MTAIVKLSKDGIGERIPDLNLLPSKAPTRNRRGSKKSSG